MFQFLRWVLLLYFPVFTDFHHFRVLDIFGFKFPNWGIKIDLDSSQTITNKIK